MRLSLLLVALCCSACRMSCFAPQAEILEAPIAGQLQAPDASTTTFDHSAFDALLQRHARPTEGRVDYAGLATQQALLETYLAALAEAPLARMAPAERKALLINAYNAFTLALILENYPGLRSIKDLPSPWKTRRWRLGGHSVSLDEIEHGLLRPIFKDPRIHFAVNCASIGCPPLAAHAFTAANIEDQLDAATRSTLANSRYASVDGQVMKLTAIMNWYGDDFVAPGWAPRADSLVAFVAAYVDGVPADASISFLDYDWRLNDVTR